MDNQELLARIELLEKEVKRQSYFTDMQEIQMLQARYIYCLENAKIAEIWDDLFAHDEPDVRMEIMDSGAYIGPEHVKRAWYTMARKVDTDGKPVSATESRMSNTNTPSAMLFLMLTISTPIVVVEKDGKTADYAQALHDAKRWVRQQEKWESPYYWGTFVLMGPN